MLTTSLLPQSMQTLPDSSSALAEITGVFDRSNRLDSVLIGDRWCDSLAGKRRVALSELCDLARLDPWGPLVAKQATAARDLMLKGMRQLEDLGSRLVVKRTAAAADVPPAVDLDAHGDEQKSAGAAKKKAKKATKAKK
jgi:hypothetical protein